ncbi:major capsid protein [Mycobacteroides abscessus]|uniref:major capsid protein n=1 Tax=Mycobacteroides abscessus TaxID=36809 RepID=UPI00092C582C|nr:major capsid protein [Mycobacteroides abscessus]SIN33807.1 phage structural protein [Mycobacteroides abscessus subsp. abscessus]
MTLWTDVITPAALTGYAREALADRERRKGTLAVFLPNRTTNDIVARFVKGTNGLLDAAEYRAYDAETSIGETPGAERVTIELPPLGRKVRVSEYDQLRLRGNVDADAALTGILKEASRLAFAISDKMEVMRGKVIDSGKAAINENGFIATADFGRGAAFTVTAATLWSDPASKPLTDLRLWRDAYVDENGDEPGVILTSRRVLNALMLSAELKALATNSAVAPGMVTETFIQSVLIDYGLPPIQVFDRRAKVAGQTVRVLPEDKLYLLPAPVAVDDEEGTDLGATVWGTTLESTEPDYEIAEVDRPGIALGTFKTRDPIGVWVHSAAIGLPTLANANLSMAAKVL